ncbi:hypothetical protein [Pedobacter heparinus]|uniref:hypothetical protein n=1 Tax=Pedobacter heparinus TaxID=984 RepID=UPI00293159B7|nr:hypothetical protein [Pedobacter heparinus]
MHAQERQELEFIRSYFKEKEPIVYTDKIDVAEYVYNLFVDICKKDTLRTYKHEARLVLAKHEKDFILAEASKIKEKSFDGNLLKKSTLIPRSKLSEIFKGKINGWQKFTKEYNGGFYSFSKPIFIRNETLCIFYVDYACGNLCGNTEIAVYKKIKDTWTEWFVLYQAVS